MVQPALPRRTHEGRQPGLLLGPGRFPLQPAADGESRLRYPGCGRRRRADSYRPHHPAPPRFRSGARDPAAAAHPASPGRGARLARPGAARLAGTLPPGGPPRGAAPDAFPGGCRGVVARQAAVGLRGTLGDGDRFSADAEEPRRGSAGDQSSRPGRPGRRLQGGAAVRPHRCAGALLCGDRKRYGPAASHEPPAAGRGGLGQDGGGGARSPARGAGRQAGRAHGADRGIGGTAYGNTHDIARAAAAGEGGTADRQHPSGGAESHSSEDGRGYGGHPDRNPCVDTGGRGLSGARPGGRGRATPVRGESEGRVEAEGPGPGPPGHDGDAYSEDPRSHSLR